MPTIARISPTPRFTAPLLLAFVLAAGCGDKPEASDARKQLPTVTIELADVKVLPVQRTIDVVGTLYGDEEATISSKVAGRVISTLADVGDRVESGQVLAKIDPTDYELARDQARMTLQQTLSRLGLTEMPGADFDVANVPTVQQAKLQADNAEARFRRAEKLFNQQPPLISEQDYADAKTAFQVARSSCDVAVLSAKSTVAEARTRLADLKIQEQRLADATLRAPQSADGSKRSYVVTSRMVSVGEYLKDGVAMFRVVADDPIRFRTAVPERYLADVTIGQKVSVSVDAYSQPFAGRLTRINPQVDPANRSFPVEINIANSRQQLRPGAFARGLIETRIDPNVTFIPQSAVVTFAGIRKVFTVKEGKAMENEVTIGSTRDGLVEILSGLKGQRQVVTTGAARLATGTPVQLKGAASQPAER